MDPVQWIPKLLGYNEKSLIERIKQGLPIELKISGGEFNQLSIQELKQSLSTNVNNLPYFTFHVRESGDDKYFDTSSLQMLIKSPVPVMFQVASNYNCHENSSMMTNLFSGHYLTNLMADTTQGPSAAAGAGAGAITRLIHHYHHPINLLDQIDAKVVNGKLHKLSKINTIDDIKIGLHTNVSANYDRSQKCKFYPEGRIIDQVFTSTIQIHNNRYNKDSVKILLQAAYEGTYLAAIHRNTHKLVLTLIGAGAFQNPINIIIECLVDAHILYAKHSKLEEVILPIYDRKISHQNIIDRLLIAGYPADKIRIQYY